AILIGDFQCIEGGVDGTPIRVCGTPGRQQLGAYALSAAQAVIHFYNEYYGIKYPFQKLDLIALPDFAAGAMDNARAVTFREPRRVKTSISCSMALRTGRPPPCCAWSNSGSARKRSAREATPICRSTPGATRRPRISGTRWRRCRSNRSTR